MHEGRLLRELKSIGALPSGATDLRKELDLAKLVGMGVWKWFVAGKSRSHVRVARSPTRVCIVWTAESIRVESTEPRESPVHPSVY